MGNVTGNVSGDLSGDNININKINDVSIDKTKKYIWGLNRDNRIYRCVEPCATGAWEEPNPNARLTDISVGKDNIYGIGGEYRIYSCKKPCDKGEWTEANPNARLIRIVGDNNF